MTLEGLCEMFDGGFSRNVHDKFPLVLMGGRANRAAKCAQTGGKDNQQRKRKFYLIEVRATSGTT